jgi:hypothetical protein
MSAGAKTSMEVDRFKYFVVGLRGHCMRTHNIGDIRRLLASNKKRVWSVILG